MIGGGVMSIPSFSLEGKVAIVTGGKRGIGRAIALAFAKAGADVVVCGRIVEGELEAVADEIQRLGRRSLAVQTDISQRNDVHNLAEGVTDEFGGIDILVNNAVVRAWAPMLELSEDDWDKVIDTDLKGYYLCSQAVGRKMVDQKRGNIINLATILAIRARAGMGVYCIAKAGVVMLTKVLALELAPYNIRVNAIAPPLVRTDSTESEFRNPEILKSKDGIPLGRFCKPSDIVGSALFLASDASNYITGHTILVDGGLHA